MTRTPGYLTDFELYQIDAKRSETGLETKRALAQTIQQLEPTLQTNSNSSNKEVKWTNHRADNKRSCDLLQQTGGSSRIAKLYSVKTAGVSLFSGKMKQLNQIYDEKDDERSLQNDKKAEDIDIEAILQGNQENNESENGKNYNNAIFHSSLTPEEEEFLDSLLGATKKPGK